MPRCRTLRRASASRPASSPRAATCRGWTSWRWPPATACRPSASAAPSNCSRRCRPRCAPTARCCSTSRSPESVPTTAFQTRSTMAIPDYQTLMLPVLELAGSGGELKFRDMVDSLAQEFRLTAVERSERLPSGSAFLFDNRVGWARTHLKHAGLLESPKRGVLRISDRGKAALASQPARIDMKFLDQFAEYREFRTRRPDAGRTDKTSGEAPRQATLEIETQRSAWPRPTRRFGSTCRPISSNR